MIDKYDHLEIYCPQLGMLLTFNYCRRSQGTLPCRNLFGCWEDRIPVDSFLIEHFSRDDLQAVFGGLPKSRIERIFEVAAQDRDIQTEK
jgi:hypothetical protein